MKTFIINKLNHLSHIGKKLDCVSLLKSQEWLVYTDQENVVEKLIFLKNNKLIYSINGLSSYSEWAYISINSSLSIESDGSTFLMKIIAYDKNIIVLNLGGTQNYCFLINGSYTPLLGCNYSDIQWYLARNCGIDIFTEEQRKEYKNQLIVEHNKNQIQIVEEKRANARFRYACAIIFVVELIVIMSIWLTI